MEDQIKLSVLWVDDKPSEDFMNEAFDYGLRITSTTCVNSGMDELRDKSKTWDAIILDANCKITDDEQEQPSLKALKKAVEELVRIRIDVPWFVYTGGDYEGVEHLEYIIKERGYDDRVFYEKPQQRYELFENIKKAVSNNDVFQIRGKYNSICELYKDADLVDLLVGYEKGGIETDANIPNSVREIMDWIMNYLNKQCALPVLFNGTNLNECSVALGMMKSFVPTHIQECFRLCVNIANEGSHGESRKLIKQNKAPYLNNTLIACLINILNWCASLSDNKDQLKESSLKSYIMNPVVKRYGRIIKSSSGALQLDGVMILNDRSIKEGDIVACVKYKNQDRYVKLAYLF